MNPDITATSDNRGVVITFGSTQYTDPINDGTVLILTKYDLPNFRLVAAVIHGIEHDLVYGYAVVGGHVYRSGLWRDLTPGILNLTGVAWSGLYTFRVDNRGTMSFDGVTNWNCDPGPGARIDGDTVMLG